MLEPIAPNFHPLPTFQPLWLSWVRLVLRQSRSRMSSEDPKFRVSTLDRRNHEFLAVTLTRNVQRGTSIWGFETNDLDSCHVTLSYLFFSFIISGMAYGSRIWIWGYGTCGQAGTKTMEVMKVFELVRGRKDIKSELSHSYNPEKCLQHEGGVSRAFSKSVLRRNVKPGEEKSCFFQGR